MAASLPLQKVGPCPSLFRVPGVSQHLSLVYLNTCLVTPDPSDDQDISVLPGGHGPVPRSPTPDQQVLPVVCKRKAAEP